MSQEIERLMKLRYPVISRERDGKVIACISELRVIAEGATPNEAFANLEKEKKRHFENMAALGLLDQIREPGSAKSAIGGFLGELGRFAAKSAVVAALAFIFLLMSLAPINALIYAQINYVSDHAKKAIAKIEAKLDSLSEKDEAAVRAKTRKYAEAIKPVVEEVQSVLVGQSLPQSQRK